jgi:predicted nucleic acid-binding Zn ribbon protein
MERAGRLIGKLKLSAETIDPETRARAAWTPAAGKKVAAHTRAAALVRGTLIVEVEDLVWQRQLVTLRHFLLRNLAAELGEALVTGLDFRPMPPRRKPQRAGAARPADEADGIADPVLGMLYRRSRTRESA